MATQDCRERHPEWEESLTDQNTYLNLIEENMCRNFVRGSCHRERLCRLTHGSYEMAKSRLRERDRDLEWVTGRYMTEISPDMVRGGAVAEAIYDRRQTLQAAAAEPRQAAPRPEPVPQKAMPKPRPATLEAYLPAPTEMVTPKTLTVKAPPFKAPPARLLLPEGTLINIESDGDITPPPPSAPAFIMRAATISMNRPSSPTPSFGRSSSPSPRWSTSLESNANKITPQRVRKAPPPPPPGPLTNLADLPIPEHDIAHHRGVDNQSEAGSEFIAQQPQWHPTGSFTNELLIAVHKDMIEMEEQGEREWHFRRLRDTFRPHDDLPKHMYEVFFDIYQHLPDVYNGRGHWKLPATEPHMPREYGSYNVQLPDRYIDVYGEVRFGKPPTASSSASSK
jgi:hypothetical protein